MKSLTNHQIFAESLFIHNKNEPLPIKYKEGTLPSQSCCWKSFQGQSTGAGPPSLENRYAVPFLPG